MDGRTLRIIAPPSYRLAFSPPHPRDLAQPSFPTDTTHVFSAYIFNVACSTRRPPTPLFGWRRTPLPFHTIPLYSEYLKRRAAWSFDRWLLMNKSEWPTPSNQTWGLSCRASTSASVLYPFLPNGIRPVTSFSGSSMWVPPPAASGIPIESRLTFFRGSNSMTFLSSFSLFFFGAEATRSLLLFFPVSLNPSLLLGCHLSLQFNVLSFLISRFAPYVASFLEVRLPPTGKMPLRLMSVSSSSSSPWTPMNLWVMGDRSWLGLQPLLTFLFFLLFNRN